MGLPIGNAGERLIQMSNETSTPRRAPTIHDVAAALGMHKSTVSLGLSGKGNVSRKTSERIRSMAREMGYQPNPLAQRLATNEGNNLISLCAGSLDVGITTEKILLIQKDLISRGLEAPIYTFSVSESANAKSQQEQIRQLCRQQPRAIVCSAHAFSQAVWQEIALYQQDGGIVVTYDVAAPLPCDQVLFDREDNAYQAARALIECGHREIGIAMSSLRRPDGELNVAQNARLRGFERALDEAGLTMRPDWIFEEANYETGGVGLAAHFLELRERPTGLCIVNDYMALAFMSQIMRAGVRIPDDLSVIGHDNQPVAAHCPVPLTCVNHPATEIAAAVVELLVGRLNGENGPPRSVTLRGEIVRRQSVAPPAR